MGVGDGIFAELGGSFRKILGLRQFMRLITLGWDFRLTSAKSGHHVLWIADKHTWTNVNTSALVFGIVELAQLDLLDDLVKVILRGIESELVRLVFFHNLLSFPASNLILIILCFLDGVTTLHIFLV